MGFWTGDQGRRWLRSFHCRAVDRPRVSGGPLPVTDSWAVTWVLQGVRHTAELPSEFEARAFAQICILLTDCTDVHLLPPIGPLTSPGSPAQIAAG